MNLRKNEEMKRLWNDLDTDTLRGQFLSVAEIEKADEKKEKDNEEEEEKEGSEKETKETYWKKLRERIYNEDD